MTSERTAIDEYLESVSPEAREALEGLRRAIRSEAPEAVESVSYGVPTFKYRGRPLIYMGAAKNHCAVYGMDVEAYRDHLAGFDTSKGTIRLPRGETLPEGLLRRIVRDRMTQIDTAAAERTRSRSRLDG